MDTPADVTDSEDAIELGDIKGHVQFEHVGFAYPDEPDVKYLMMLILTSDRERQSHSWDLPEQVKQQ